MAIALALSAVPASAGNFGSSRFGFQGGLTSSSHDHRMAMALTVASLGADSPVIIDDRDCVAKSFPDFFEKWEQANA